MTEIKIFKRFTTTLCIISLLAAMFYPVPGYAATNDADEMPLLITEAYIDDISRTDLLPKNYKTIDACEFIEVYNQTDDPINFTEEKYSIYHTRNSTDGNTTTEYNLSLYNIFDYVVIPSHDSVIFC